MKDLISKWWNRKWGIWRPVYEYFSWSDCNCYIILKRTSDDGLFQFKKIIKK